MSFPVTIGKFQLLGIEYRPHTEHNPHCNIIVGKYKNQDGKLFLLTHVDDLENNQSFYEYYSGENYLVESKDKSNSHIYNGGSLPIKYEDIAKDLYGRFIDHLWPELVKE